MPDVTQFIHTVRSRYRTWSAYDTRTGETIVDDCDCQAEAEAKAEEILLSQLEREMEDA